MADHERRSDGFTAIEDRYAGYTVHDRDGEKIGKVDDLFLDENDRPEYIGVKTGFLGTRSTLIPMEIATTDEANSSITVSADKQTVKDGPSFDDDREITPEYEREVLGYYGVDRASTGESSGSYGDYYGHEGSAEHSGAISTGPETAGTRGPGMSMGDTERGHFEEHGRGQEGPGADDDKSDLEDEDELRVQRSEEELRAGTREREAGAMRVRKRVRTDRERLEVPVKREEVSVERVPVSGEATEAQIGEDEVEVPVTEEEVVVDKRAVAKEEVRIRKDVVEDTEVVEEDRPPRGGRRRGRHRAGPGHRNLGSNPHRAGFGGRLSRGRGPFARARQGSAYPRRLPRTSRGAIGAALPRSRRPARSRVEIADRRRGTIATVQSSRNHAMTPPPATWA